MALFVLDDQELRQPQRVFLVVLRAPSWINRVLTLHFGNGFLCQDAIRLQCQHDGLLQIRSGLFQGFPLRIRAGQFFYEPDIALGRLYENRAEFHVGNLSSRCLGTRTA